MLWWPGWNSVADADWWSNFYFWLGIGALLLLGASEVVAHRYSLRKDELVAASEVETQRKHDTEAASLREELAAAKAAREPRHLTQGQMTKLTEALKTIPPQTVIIQAGTTEGDENALSNQIADAMVAAGWQRPTSANSLFFGPDTAGVWISIKGDGGEPVPVAVEATLDALRSAGVKVQDGIRAEKTAAANTVLISIGRR